MKTKPLKDEIDSLINDEFPLNTFQDTQTKNIKVKIKKWKKYIFLQFIYICQIIYQHIIKYWTK